LYAIVTEHGRAVERLHDCENEATGEIITGDVESVSSRISATIRAH
jgi:hypothetical protein